ncbi:MAG: hypothetical protein U0Y10_12300 [Spirosomataceae bacterium]
MKSLKLNWGQSIVLAFILFALFIGSMIYGMVTAHVEMAPGYKTTKTAHP